MGVFSDLVHEIKLATESSCELSTVILYSHYIADIHATVKCILLHKYQDCVTRFVNRTHSSSRTKSDLLPDTVVLGCGDHTVVYGRNVIPEKVRER